MSSKVHLFLIALLEWEIVLYILRGAQKPKLLQFKINITLALLRNGGLNWVPVVFDQKNFKFMQWGIVK